MTPNERKSVLSLALLYASRMLGLFMVLPVFVLYADSLQDATPVLIGLAIGAYGLSQALLQIPFGALSDRYGRKPLLYLGLVLFFVGSVIAAMSESIYGVIVGRLIQGAGAIAAVIMALLSDLTTDESRTKAMAFVGISIGLSFTVALILGPVVAEIGGLQAIFWLTAFMALIGLLWSWYAIPTPSVLTKSRDSRVFKDEFYRVIRNTELLRLDFGVFTLHLVLTALFIAIPVSLVGSVDIAQSYHWMVYLFVTVGSFVCMIPLIIVGEKHQKMKGIFCLAIALVAIASGSMIITSVAPILFISSLFFFFMGFNLLEASLPSLVSKICPAGAKGTAMGVYSTSQFFGAFLGGVSGGLLLTAYGVDGIYIFAALVLAVWLFVALGMQKPKHEKTLTIYFNAHLGNQEINQLNNELISVEGVEQAVVVSDGVAYLKVLSKNLDESALELLKQKYA